MPLDSARSSLRLDEQVHVVALHRVVDEAKPEAVRPAPERPRQRGEAAPAAQVPHAGAHAPRDVDGKARVEHGTAPVHDAAPRMCRLAPGPGPRAAPRPEREALLSLSTPRHLDDAPCVRRRQVARCDGAKKRCPIKVALGWMRRVLVITRRLRSCGQLHRRLSRWKVPNRDGGLRDGGPTLAPPSCVFVWASFVRGGILIGHLSPARRRPAGAGASFAASFAASVAATSPPRRRKLRRHVAATSPPRRRDVAQHLRRRLSAPPRPPARRLRPCPRSIHR